jgi:hypothetical protein
MDFSKNPSAVNPEWNFVYSANNQAEAVDGFYILVIIFQKTELKNYPVIRAKVRLGQRICW